MTKSKRSVSRKAHTTIRRIAINTGGGDAPGLNAVIRAATLAALNQGWDVVGIRDGYHGLMMPEKYPDGGLIPLTRDRVRGITHRGGTILGTTNRGNPLCFPVVDKRGNITEVDRSDELIRLFRQHKIDALLAVGGDGSLAIANVLARKGLIRLSRLRRNAWIDCIPRLKRISASWSWK
jgi:6-phosphofructokinase 1